MLLISDDGQPTLQRDGSSIAIPRHIDGLAVERIANYIILRADGLGFTVKWDTQVRTHTFNEDREGFNGRR